MTQKNLAFILIVNARESGTSPIRLSPIIGENPEDVLAKVHLKFTNWRKCRGYIDKSSLEIRQLAKVHWTFANSESRVFEIPIRELPVIRIQSLLMMIFGI
jgi:hypothetical protein